MSIDVNFVLAHKINTFGVHNVRGTLVLHRPKWNEDRTHRNAVGVIKWD